jgi:hypothetical protein
MRALCFAFCFVMLAGCASLPGIANILFGKSEQKITRDPIWVYKPDLRIIVDGATFEGMGVTKLSEQTPIYIESLVNIDRVEISSCARHDVCQVKAGSLACDLSRFHVEKSWFGNPGKKMLYVFRPSSREKQGNCANLTIAIYDKQALAAWGHLTFRATPELNFPAKFSCNATDWTFAGVSVCSAKAGYVQKIYFDRPVDGHKADPECNVTKISDAEFEFQPAIGWCRAGFLRDGKYHGVTINGYDEVLIREK